MKKLFLLRHGQTDFSGKYIGASDVLLSNAGREEIRTIKKNLQLRTFDSIFCSPMRRCKETLDLLQIQQEIQIDDLLKEINFGDWEKKTFSEVNERDPDLVEKWAENDSSFSFPGGESYHSFHKRIEKFRSVINSLDKNNNTILIVSHGGVIRHLICLLLGIPYENYLYFKVDTGKLAIIDLYSSGGVLCGLNLGDMNG